MGATGLVRWNRGLDHAGLAVTDLDAAVDFFVGQLGARVVFRLDRPAPGQPCGAERLGAPASAQFSLALLELDGARLELLQWWYDEPPGQAAAGHADGVHAAIEVADVPAAVDALRAAAGVIVLGEPVTFADGPTPGLTNAFLRTPGGVLLELVSWPDA